ncbi:MAG: flagellar basal-body MS-ring/collar protein FliF [Pseudomonadota bacterium]
MESLLTTWNALTTTKKLIAAGSVLATVVLFALLARTASTPSMALLYAGLDGRTSGEVIAALEQMDVAFEVRGDAIYVPQGRRDAARMTLAGRGLPQAGQAGYELLDALNGFSTTSDMFDATFWRAKEGELARTITASPGVAAARVHIAHADGGPFARRAVEPTAVVTVTMSRGGLGVPQAQGIQFLVGSAVPGLAPEKVAVLDSARGVVLSPGETNPVAMGEGDPSEREQRMENDIKSLLEARVGRGNARVQIALDIDREREAITERVFDPEGRVVSGREVNEVTENSSGSGGTSVTVASNLPEGDAGGAPNDQQSSRTETREIISYDMSEVRREREKLPGSIRRMSVAVLVNQSAVAGEAADAVEPAELDALRDLVAQAAGLDEARGDTISVRAMPFTSASDEGVLVSANPIGSFFARNLMSMIQIAVLAIVTLVMGLFVVKPVLSAQAPAPEEPDDVLDELPAFPAFDELPDNDEPDAIESLKSIAGDKTDETATLLKTWLEAEQAEQAS